jgi:hypothetical protein
MSAMSDVYAKARSEIIALFGWNVDKLSPDQTLRLDCAVALRLALDDLQGRIVRGELIDVAKMMTTAEALSRLLPPAVLAAPPPEHREDPRQYMWRTYLGMRQRGEIGDAVVEAREVDRLRARVAELEAQLAGRAPDEPSAAPPAPADNVVPLKPAAAAPATPEEEYEEVVVTEAALGAPEPWRGFISGDGSIMTPGRKYWGPV